MARWRLGALVAFAGVLLMVVPAAVAGSTAGNLGSKPANSRADGPTLHFPAKKFAAKSVPGRSLRVRPPQPPSGQGTVVLRGPEGFRLAADRSTTVKQLQIGRYWLSAKTKATARWVATPSLSQKRVWVTAKRGARVTVSYWNAVSANVDVLQPDAVRDYRAPDPATGDPGEFYNPGAGGGRRHPRRRRRPGHPGRDAGPRSPTPSGPVVAIDRWLSRHGWTRRSRAGSSRLATSRTWPRQSHGQEVRPVRTQQRGWGALYLGRRLPPSTRRAVWTSRWPAAGAAPGRR